MLSRSGESLVPPATLNQHTGILFFFYFEGMLKRTKCTADYSLTPLLLSHIYPVCQNGSDVLMFLLFFLSGERLNELCERERKKQNASWF